MAYRFILASASPRRKELLEQVGAKFEIIPAKGEEIITKSNPEEAVVELSAQKAAEVAERLQQGQLAVRTDTVDVGNNTDTTVILGADTVVAFAGRILGKPKDEADAEQMLSMLSGNTHSVYTGVTIIAAQDGKTKYYSLCEETKVTMFPIAKQQILSYIRTGEPMDKAGAYGIQGKGARYIERIEGDYNNVVGLPVSKIFQVLSKSGIEIL